jgi:hypothetical protein
MQNSVVVVAGSEEACHELAFNNFLAPDQYFKSCVRMTGQEQIIHNCESMMEIPLSDRILMNQYMKYLNKNKYNGFGYRDLHPDLADTFVLEVCEWLDAAS